MLDLIQQSLRLHNFSFVRIDGQTKLEQRKDAMTHLNEDNECTVMLATIGSVGEGLV